MKLISSSLDDLELINNYEKYYKNKKISKLYPNEFVIRIFKGNYSKSYSK